ncbi:TIR domain-containing protein [Niabella hibiscisoli]|uniref:TIR domain-containing protein n=1 Tax=Niabella hibiscisoli TaxID=1825928 RepID=UPI001F0D929D|nr:TIR domain-containing protein [Niabella hibiscisoli]MCH5720861.1 toll/interleukin-1 receptor domain-containing protein [Niabella hibiscisoli]
MGMVSFENANLTRNQIAYALIELLGNMQSEVKEQQKRVFISYNHKDVATASRVRELLVKAGVEVTIDSEAMGAGDNIKAFIEKV